MIATASAWFSGRNATGRRPAARAAHVERELRAGTLVTIRLNSRVEKFSREACARIVGGAKRCTPASTSAPTACLDSFRPSIASRTTRQPRDRVLDVDRQRPAHAAMRLPSVRAGRPCGSTRARARAARGPPCARRARAASAQRAGDDRQHDVVDRAAEAFLTALKSRSSLRTQTERRWRADLDVQRRAGAGFSPAQPTSPSPRAPRARAAAAAGRVSSEAARAAPSPTRGASADAPPATSSSAGRLGRGCQAPPGAGSAWARGEIEHAPSPVDARDAVDQRVVGLGDEREAAARRRPSTIPHAPTAAWSGRAAGR
jgi:hypothetical protein